MNWILLVLNIATAIIAVRKRVLPYSILTAIFVVLVVGQAFQMESDFQDSYTLTYAYSTVSDRGFAYAQWYVFVVSVISLILSCVARGYKKGSQPGSRYWFNPSPAFYFVMIGVLSAIGGILIFGIVGLSAFLNTSRPGNQSGATLFITLISIGIFPLLLKLMFPGKIGSWDIVCFGISLLVTAGFSRIHVILYLLILLITLFYCRGWADRAFSLRTARLFIGFGTTLLLFFFIVGALRDAQNFTEGSVGDLINYTLDHPETSLLSLQYTYRVSVEGMSGLAGAFSDALLQPDNVRNDYGLSAGIDGLAQMLPAPLKHGAQDLITSVESLYWYEKPAGNVSPGIETSFVSFGWPGSIIYPCIFFAIFWNLPVMVLTRRLSPPLMLSAFMCFGCGIFFVRGSWADWIAFSVSYSIVIIVAWPFFSLYFTKNIVRAEA